MAFHGSIVNIPVVILLNKTDFYSFSASIGRIFSGQYETSFNITSSGRYLIWLEISRFPAHCHKCCGFISYITKCYDVSRKHHFLAISDCLLVLYSFLSLFHNKLYALLCEDDIVFPLGLIILQCLTARCESLCY